MADLRLTPASGEDGTRVAVSGDLDITAAESLDAAVAEALAGGARQLLIDLTPTTFVDSTGLAHLLAARREADAAGVALRVLAPRGSEARVVIELAGVGSIVGLEEPAG